MKQPERQVTMEEYEQGSALVEAHMPECPGPDCAKVEAALHELGLA